MSIRINTNAIIYLFMFRDESIDVSMDLTAGAELRILCTYVILSMFLLLQEYRRIIFDIILSHRNRSLSVNSKADLLVEILVLV